nr:MAG: hypothetical protein [Microvirus sp.]
MNKLFQYRKRPALVSGSPRSDRLNERGEYVPDPKPHPDLLANPFPIPLAEQVRNLERHSMLVRKASLLDRLADDDFGDGWFDDMNEPLTNHELAALAPYQAGTPTAKTPIPLADVSGDQNAPSQSSGVQSAPTGQ